MSGRATAMIALVGQWRQLWSCSRYDDARIGFRSAGPGLVLAVGARARARARSLGPPGQIPRRRRYAGAESPRAQLIAGVKVKARPKVVFEAHERGARAAAHVELARKTLTIESRAAHRRSVRVGPRGRVTIGPKRSTRQGRS